ncbi:lipopolysaccharide transport periplasmic protein LptA [Neisseria animalis]|uniref:Lipopolysaccharide export system protein LptA n=1 Tax=Neisseria animalis TaxID=492 RepID=A0A5P3MRE4_NEIAN|nr:lipopolysaccharide transport periplasmic protein LptA [Neisseria animalis]QEY24098.1 lipopolysaccharide transport periplasmic protein LptA [Neisseria animalis]ROW32666.1 lipopolysaccharide transport periplasmic protein LptA [Neisseria animalis]VEE06280.1 lipopolysaccharide ABC transporter, periplasmic lipopolysaccharide-binding protein [Neisseria animalis]
MMSKIYKAAALVLISAAAPAFALQSDSRQPIQIEADQGMLDQANQTTTFSGNVIIRQGTININADSVTVARDGKGNQIMQAKGSPVRFSQTLDDNKGVVKGRGSRVDYTSANGVVVLTGSARVERGGDVAEGSVITYNTHSEVYTIAGPSKTGGTKSAAKSGRVSVVIQPSSVGKQ